MMRGLLKSLPSYAHKTRKTKHSSLIYQRLASLPVIGSLLTAIESRRASSDRVLVRKLIQAAELGQIEVLQRTLERGVNVNAKRHRGGRTALMKAASNNHTEAVRILLAHGASVDTSGGRSQNTALMRAASNNCVNSMELLLIAAANPNKTNHLTGKTPLMMAAAKGHLQAVEMLIAFHADPDGTDHKGKTALMYAASQNARDNQEIVLRLIRSGAGINRKDHQGRKAVDFAHEAGLSNIVGILEAHGASWDDGSRRSSEQYYTLAMLKRAYACLGCAEKDSDDKIKNQYHTRAKKYHPDAMSALGLTDEFMELAERKFREVNEAYQVIMKSRKKPL